MDCGKVICHNKNMAKVMKIKMSYRTGETFYWRVQKVAGGWEFRDHENYARFVEGNWFDLLAEFRLTASNHAMISNIS